MRVRSHVLEGAVALCLYFCLCSCLCFCLGLAITPARAFESDLSGAWVQDRAECQELFSRSGKTISFRTPSSAFAQAFIIEGRRLTTPKASCRIKAVKKIGGRRILALSCTTLVAIDEIPAILEPMADGTLRRYTNEADQQGSRYERCSP